MCHMLFIRFIFVRRRLSSFIPLLLFVSLSLVLAHYICFARYFHSLAHEPPLLLYPNVLPSLPLALPRPSRSRCSSIFATLSLAYSKSRSPSFLSVSLLLATSLILFSVLLASLSSPCLPFRLLVYTLVTRSPPFSLSLAVVRCSPVFLARVLASLFPRVHHCGGTLRFIVSVSRSLSHSRFRLVPPAHLSTHVERYFSPFSSFVQPSLSLFRANRRFIPSAQGRLKTSQTLSASKQKRSE